MYCLLWHCYVLAVVNLILIIMLMSEYERVIVVYDEVFYAYAVYAN